MSDFDLIDLIRETRNSSESAMKHAVEMLLEESGLQEAFFLELDSSGDALKQVTRYSASSRPGKSGVSVGDEFDWSTSSCKRLLENNSIFSPDIQKDYPDHELAKKLGVRSYLSIPLTAGSETRVIGSLCAMSDEVHNLSAKQIQKAQLLALLLNKVIEQERLSIEIKQRQEMLLHTLQERTERVAEQEHRIKTSIAAITGWLELGASDSDSAAKAIEVALRRSTELHEQLTEMILEAKENLTQDVRPGSVLISTLISDVVELVSPKIENREIELEGNFVGWISADYFAIRDCLIHLLDNAITHTSGSISIAHDFKDNMHSIAIVSDFNGYVPNFGKVADRLTDRHSGTGVGLSVVKTLAESMGGSVLASQVGDQLVLTTNWRKGEEQVRLTSKVSD